MMLNLRELAIDKLDETQFQSIELRFKHLPRTIATQGRCETRDYEDQGKELYRE